MFNTCVCVCRLKCPAELDWASKLVIPVCFSVDTNKVIETGLLSRRAHAEIVTSLSTLMLVHTCRPSPSDLTTVCRRLVERHPNLRDKVDNGFVSDNITCTLKRNI